MSNQIDKFQDMAASASDAGRTQYEAIVSGMESSQAIGDAALERHLKALEQEFDHRRLIAQQYARAKALRNFK
jgi:hypothetical protein